MSGRRAGNLPGTLQETGDDILDLYQLRPHFSGPCVEHHRYFSDPSRGIRNQLEVQRWTRFRELGSGAFGTVFLEREENNGSLRAVKVLSKAKYKTKAVNYLREILAMANLSREDAYFIQLYGWFSDDTNIYIAMEFAPHGDLHDCVQQPLPEVEAREITRQIAEALEIMHSKKFAHRDLKPSNIFVVQRGPSWWVKLGDFGVAKRVANDFTRYRTSIDTDFTAPDISFPDVEEEEEADEYTSKVDMWSLGCLLHWLLTLELPLNKKQMYALCLAINLISNPSLIPYLFRIEGHQPSIQAISPPGHRREQPSAHAPAQLVRRRFWEIPKQIKHGRTGFTRFLAVGGIQQPKALFTPYLVQTLVLYGPNPV
ncbi:hypothetical protein LTR40_002896 [Exophiala xenobiotica]|nr:hypothetical protein LTR40_002896 [Exophiala xenobiotica]